jgi:hypothetical protein
MFLFINIPPLVAAAKPWGEIQIDFYAHLIGTQ